MQTSAKNNQAPQYLIRLAHALGQVAAYGSDLVITGAKRTRKAWQNSEGARTRLLQDLLDKKDRVLLWLKKRGLSPSAFDRIVKNLDKLSHEELAKLKKIINEL